MLITRVNCIPAQADIISLIKAVLLVSCSHIHMKYELCSHNAFGASASAQDVIQGSFGEYLYLGPLQGQIYINSPAPSHVYQSLDASSSATG